MNKIDTLAEYYPLQDILEQNDIENSVVIEFLVSEGLIDLDDYFFEELEVDDDA